MVTMISRAIVKIKIVEFSLQHAQTDDAWLDIACYDTQQALEFAIKAYLLSRAVEFEHIHNIRYLLTLAEENGLEFEKSERAISIADTITSWEQDGRYGKGIRTTVNTIREVLNITKRVVEVVMSESEDNAE